MSLFNFPFMFYFFHSFNKSNPHVLQQCTNYSLINIVVDLQQSYENFKN